MPEPIKSIGIIGLGIMGGAIARNLIAAGFRVGAFDIDKGRAAAAAVRVRSMSKPLTRNPAALRLRAIAPPMMPRPMTATLRIAAIPRFSFA